MVFVTKFDGRKQPFDKEKVIRTCLKMHASEEQARSVADRVEAKVYDGISTKKILQMIFAYLKQYRPEVKNRIDLREAIGLLRSKPDFEQFVALLLQEYGYKILTNQIVPGKCVGHEIDAIARKDDEVIYVEVKHHLQHHTFSGIGVFLEARATFEDLQEGFQAGKHNFNFSKGLVVCNTKISDHAMQYAFCRDIGYVSWNYPSERCLSKMVEEKRLYPITLLKDLDEKTEQMLGDNNILLLKQLIELDADELMHRIKIPKQKIKLLQEKARELLQS
jgi:Holliday junction resolvase-like predicted endonuclease